MLQTRTRLAVSATVLASMLTLAAVALASNRTPPIPMSPANGGTQNAGRVTLVVFDPGLHGPVASPVFLILSDKRVLDKHRHLTSSRHCGPRCDFKAMTRWKGHPGTWIYRAPYRFRGYWGVTPGTYFWQVHHFVPGCKPACVEYSGIHMFRVVG